MTGEYGGRTLLADETDPRGMFHMMRGLLRFVSHFTSLVTLIANIVSKARYPTHAEGSIHHVIDQSASVQGASTAPNVN